MIISRNSVIAAIARQKEGRTGHIEPSAEDATTMWLFAKRLVPLIAQMEALFWSRGGQVTTPAEANAALALHQAEPEMFDFPDCRCGKHLQQGDCTYEPHKPCSRMVWLERLRERSRMPADVKTAPVPVPQRSVSR